jgi:hypothetical protein
MRDENFLNQLPIANCGINIFFIVIHRFSLVKAAMNALHLCKLSKDCLSGNGHGVMTPKFLNFPIDKGGTKTIAHLSIAEGLSFRSLDRRIYVCKLRIEKIKI